MLCDESGGASLVVVGHRNRRGDGLVLLGSVGGVVASSVCPVVVLRNVPPSEEGGVVAGIDGGPTSQTVLEFAFEYASRHGMPVTAAMCIPPLLHRHGSGDGAHLDKARRWLFEATSGWRERYPDVALDHVVVTDHTVDGLVQTAIGQRLLVVGVNRDHHRIGAILGSVANSLLHHAPCAVAAVPVHAKGLKKRVADQRHLSRAATLTLKRRDDELSAVSKEQRWSPCEPGSPTRRATWSSTTIPVPEPVAEEVLVEVLACGVCRTDLHRRRRRDPCAPGPRRPRPSRSSAGSSNGRDRRRDSRVGDRVGVPWLAWDLRTSACSADRPREPLPEAVYTGQGRRRRLCRA